jgi:hypothetical protein
MKTCHRAAGRRQPGERRRADKEKRPPREERRAFLGVGGADANRGVRREGTAPPKLQPFITPAATK